MFASSLLGSVVGSVIGSAIAHQFLGGSGHLPAEMPGDQSASNEVAADDDMDTADADASDYDVGGDIGGDDFS
jgi:uncharacterized protein YcfJ